MSNDDIQHWVSNSNNKKNYAHTFSINFVTLDPNKCTTPLSPERLAHFKVFRKTMRFLTHKVGSSDENLLYVRGWENNLYYCGNFLSKSPVIKQTKSNLVEQCGPTSFYCGPSETKNLFRGPRFKLGMCYPK